MTAFTNVFDALQSFAANGPQGLKVNRFPGGTQTLHLIEDLSIRILWEKRGEVIDVQVSDVVKKTADFFNWFTGGSVVVDGRDWVIAQAEKVITPLPVTHHLKTLEDVRRVCTEQLNVQRKTAPDMAAPGYKAGPLAGIFASAPYLHNGSVPTLDALLLPPGQRPVMFTVGAVLFDPVKVGLGAAQQGGLVNEFSVTDAAGAVIPGDFNGGHAYPSVALTDTERTQLVTYLKGL
jgi:hypothetical protein